MRFLPAIIFVVTFAAILFSGQEAEAQGVSPTWTPEPGRVAPVVPVGATATPWPTAEFQFDDEDLNTRYGSDWIDAGSSQFFMIIALLGGVTIALGFRSPMAGVAVACIVIGVGVIRTDGIPVMLIVLLIGSALAFVGLFFWSRQGR